MNKKEKQEYEEFMLDDHSNEGFIINNNWIIQQLQLKVKKLENNYKMRKVKIIKKNKLTIKNIEGYAVREVTQFGNSAKVSCPKEFLGRKVYLVIANESM